MMDRLVMMGRLVDDGSVVGMKGRWLGGVVG